MLDLFDQSERGVRRLVEGSNTMCNFYGFLQRGLRSHGLSTAGQCDSFGDQGLRQDSLMPCFPETRDGIACRNFSFRVPLLRDEDLRASLVDLRNFDLISNTD